LDLSSSADIAGDLVLSGGGDGALQFTNAGENSIKIPDNQASALIIEEADNAYITFVTTNGSEAITVAKATTFSGGIANAGTIAAGAWEGTDVAVAHGGTGASSATDGFDALSPMTTEGDIVYGGSSGTVTRLGIGDNDQVLTLASGVPSWAAASGGGSTSWDAVAAASGGDYTTIQAADDALDSATTGYSLFVKGQQEYAEDVTISTDGAYIFIEATTTLDGNWVISGDNCHVVVGPGAIIEGNWTLSGAGNTVEFGGGFLWTGNGTMSGAGNTLRLGADSDHVGINTMSGAEGSIYCGNGVETDGLVVTANSCLFDGGGFYTTIDGGTARSAVVVTAGHGFRLSNCGVENSRDNDNAYDGVKLIGTAVFKIDNVHVHQSDQNGFNIQSDTGVTRGQISNIYMDACNDAGIYIDMDRVVMQNIMMSSCNYGITIAATGDNATIMGANLQAMAQSSPINIDTNAENCVVVGNRVDGTITDNSGTSTVASNDLTTF